MMSTARPASCSVSWALHMIPTALEVLAHCEEQSRESDNCLAAISPAKLWDTCTR